MTTDTKRMLELAAKAIGGTLSEGHTRRRTGPTWDDWEWVGEPGIKTGPDWRPYPGVTIHPLTNGGDALDLAAALRLTVGDEDQSVRSMAFAYARHREDLPHCYEPSGIDPASAYCRVIVRFAAAIGEAMP